MLCTSRSILIGAILCSLAEADSLRLAEWNLYYKALDDSFGRAAITEAIDGAGTLDMMLAVEVPPSMISDPVRA